MSHVVIIGNGVAGITAARHIRKMSDNRITVISGETDFFFSRTALMYIYMGHMKYEHTKPYEDWFWSKNRIDLIRGWIENVDFNKKQLHFSDERELSYDQLILATGSKSNKFGWPGQDLNGVQGLYSYQDLESMESHTKNIDRAVVVGGGLIGIEMAEMLHSRGIPVTFLVREQSFWDPVLPPDESELVNRHIREYDIDLRLATELKEIIDDGNGHVKSVITNSGEEIACGFVGLTVGVSPNVDFLRQTDLEIDKGILVDDFLKTNIPDVYAIGDCVQIRNPLNHRKPIEAVWYAGRMMGETVAQTICGIKMKYMPGVWFNSAKFFDIEYQVYGQVNPSPESHEDSLYWEDGDGKKCVRIVFDQQSQAVLGMNALGTRFRHEVWEQWIGAGTRIQEVILNLHRSSFDPEFFQPVDIGIRQVYNRKFPDAAIPQRKRSFFERILS